MEATPWLTIEEAAIYLKCSERYLRERVANRNVPFTMFGGKALFNRNRIDQWLLSLEEYNQPQKGAIASDNLVDTKIELDCDKSKIQSLIDKLITFDHSFVMRLGNNLLNDLKASEYKELTVKTYAQLSRWCHPKRQSKREKMVVPIVHQISECLYGKVIDRTNHPSYK